MPEEKRTGGGKATTGGTTFQEDVTAYLCTLVLAESDAHPLAGLSSDTQLSDVFAEGVARPVDDLAARNSAGGRVFLQSKTTLSLSDGDESELAKVIDQFAGQVLVGDVAPGSEPRKLELAHDRLALAVGHDAPGTIATTLRAALDAVRNASTPAQLEEIAAGLNVEQADALKTVRAHLGRAWRKRGGHAPTADEELSALRLIHVVQFDFRPDGAERTRAHDLLRRLVTEPARATDAWNALVGVGRRFGPERKGGDAAFLRSELERGGIPLAARPTYRQDIANVKAYTERRLLNLRTHAEISFAGRSLKIKRGAAVDLATFAAEGHATVTGEPGAGKSGVLYDACELLKASADVVVLTADDLNATSRESLASDLGITTGRSVADVLANWPGAGPGYFVVDALDVAARAGMNLRVLCALIQEIRQRARRWHVVVSMREYDLNTSVQVQDLFRGKPHPTRGDPRFSQLRHLRVTQLDADELRQLDETRVAEALAAASPALRQLVSNPFNLALLCSLLDVNVSGAELGRVEAQVGLLELYWRYRVEASDMTNRTAALAAAVDVMIEGRAMHASLVEIGRRAGTAASAMDGLLQDGVVIDFGTAPAGARLGFPHNILFDYAAARLWAGSLDDFFIGSLAAPDRQYLLLAMRPSLVMAFERLWLGEADHAQFWNRALGVQQNAGLRPVGKIVAAGVAAEHFRALSDVDLLIAALGDERSPGTSLLRSFLTATLTQEQPLVGQGAAPWMEVASRLMAHPAAAWDARRLLGQASRSSATFTPDQAKHANVAARALIEHGLTDSRRYGLVRTGLEVAAQTIAVDPPGTSTALSKVLEPDHFAAGGHEWLHPVADRLGVIAESDPTLALRIVSVSFSSSGSRDDKVPLGGRLLPMVFNKHDMIAMAPHHVSKRFPEIMRRDAVTGTRMLISVMELVAVSERDGKKLSIRTTPFRGGTAKFQPDGSFVWAEANYNEHKDWSKLLETFEEVLVELAKGGKLDPLDAVLDLLRDENRLCVIWNRLLTAATAAPELLGTRVAELLASPFVLGSSEMRSWAGDLLKASYQYLSKENRTAIETAIRRLVDDADADHKEGAERRRNQMLGCLPAEFIVADDLRRLRDELARADKLPGNERDFSGSFGGSEDLDEDCWLRHHGMSPTNAANKPLLMLKKQIEAIGGPANAKQPIAAETLAEHTGAIAKLEEAVAQGAAAGADAPLIEDCKAKILEACEHLAGATGLTREAAETRFIRERLLAGSSDERPLPNPEVDAKWDKEMPSWSSTPRVEAASGLMRLACQPEAVDEEILIAIERLAGDPVPAVRFQVLAHANCLARTASDRMWRIIEKAAATERYAAIMGALTQAALLRLPRGDGRQEAVARRLNHRGRRMPGGAQVRRAVANYYTLAAAYASDHNAERYLGVIAANPCSHAIEAGYIIDLCRHFMRIDDSARSEDDNRRIRTAAFRFLTALTQSVHREIDAIRAKHAKTPNAPLPEGDMERLGTAYQLAHGVATELYFAAGAFDAKNEAEGKPARHPSPSDDRKRRFFNEAEPLLKELCDLDVVEAAYDVAQTLQFFVDVEPKRTLLLLAALMRRSASDGIQYESMAADLAAAIAETYLSDHAALLRVDATMQSALLDILDIFVTAGWTGATRLTYRLEEAFR